MLVRRGLIPTDVERCPIVLALVELRRAGVLAGLWIDELRIRVTLPGYTECRRALSWGQAVRLVGGEPLEKVMRNGDGHPRRKRR